MEQLFKPSNTLVRVVTDHKYKKGHFAFGTIGYVFVFLLSMLFISCNNKNKEASTRNSELNNKATAPEKKSQITTFDSDSIIKKVQGEWREKEYPFRKIYFKNTTVKFTEEGMAEEPAFRAFKILKDCPFEVNNLKNAGPNDQFLVMAEPGTCEILNVSNDTLTLSGFSVNTNLDYNIVYYKVK